MLGVGPEEIILIALLALLVLGPERLPKVMRDMGRIVGDLRRTSDELRDEFLNADKLLEGKPSSSGTAAASTPAPATVESTSSGPPGESAFDREMREARGRLKGN
jgi:Tat protein translocase TatB subunit